LRHGHSELSAMEVSSESDGFNPRLRKGPLARGELVAAAASLQLANDTLAFEARALERRCIGLQKEVAQLEGASIIHRFASWGCCCYTRERDPCHSSPQLLLQKSDRGGRPPGAM